MPFVSEESRVVGPEAVNSYKNERWWHHYARPICAAVAHSVPEAPESMDTLTLRTSPTPVGSDTKRYTSSSVTYNISGYFDSNAPSKRSNTVKLADRKSFS